MVRQGGGGGQGDGARPVHDPGRRRRAGQPHAALRFLNDAMLQQLPGSERFITAAYVLLNPAP
ncbi:MAG: hypothetical protein M3P91_04975 [Actinomycetota bacterium]|nr:hypothetical protein [Actinomycetota bacterium]